MFRDFLNGLVGDPLWPAVSAQTLARVIDRVGPALKQDAFFGPFLEGVRKFNRLSHKKMFLVETSPGTGCLLIGGRNLADHYLVSANHGFHDSDVMICRNEGNHTHDAAFNAAQASFATLLTDLNDPAAPRAKVKIATVPRRDSFQFSKFVAGDLAAPSSIGGSLIAGDAQLPAASNFNLLTSEWSVASDQIRAEFLRMIRTESKEIFIESPYAEFDSEIKQALRDAAAKRGVRITIITNGLFTSDGPSKLIRFTMQNFYDQMRADFPDTFFVLFTHPFARRMTHAKIAVFRGQKSETGADVVRTMMGSHNFHQRSSISDKEHMMVWDQPAGRGEDVIDFRMARYNEFKKTTGNPHIGRFDRSFSKLERKFFDGIIFELAAIRAMRDTYMKIKTPDGIAETAHTKYYIQVIGGSLFGTGSGLPTSFEAKNHAKYVDMKAKIDESGLADVIGLFL